jgi:Rrf2 family protein
MKISTKGRYGLRILLDLATHPSDTPRMIHAIADEQGISPKYISRLIIALRKAGMVQSVRGAGGGYKLACDPRAITLLQIVEVMEGPIGLVDCVHAPKRCRRMQHCAARRIWSLLTEQIRERMAAVTLQMLLDAQETCAADGPADDVCI